MHPDLSFRWEDRAEMLAWIGENCFCTLFAGGHVVHVPVVVHGVDQLRFHVARSNRAAASLAEAEALLSCIGGNAYVSPDWYGTPDQVPTWNYVAVEGRGRLRQLGPEELVAQIDALSAVQEEKLKPKPPWTRAKMTPARFEAMARAIIGYELRIDAIEGTRKLGQNKRPQEREGALAGLAANGRCEMAALMRAAFDKA